MQYPLKTMTKAKHIYIYIYIYIYNDMKQYSCFPISTQLHSHDSDFKSCWEVKINLRSKLTHLWLLLLLHAW